MNTKTKLAKLILIQIESLSEVAKENSPLRYTDMMTLANEITRDAEQLAQIIEQENKQIA